MPAFYEMHLDIDYIEKQEKKGKPFICSEKDNVDDIEIEGYKKGFFRYSIYEGKLNFKWPEINLYYRSELSERECDFLYNICDWPVLHKRVMNALIGNNIKGIDFYPVNLIDMTTGNVNHDYYVIHVKNIIAAYDMKRSNYIYIEKDNSYVFLPRQTFLDPDVCEGYDFFREVKFFPPMYVSERVKNIIEENGFTGFGFICMV